MTIHYQIEGSPNSPVLVFSNSLGSDLHMWDRVVPLLLPYFQIIRYDVRGTGKSESATGPYNITQLGQDVIDLLDDLNLDKVHFCGLSMGGLTGQWLGIHHRDRIHKLVLSNTATKIGTEAGWNDRIELIRDQGMQAIWDRTRNVWFGDSFQRENPDLIAMEQQRFLRIKVDGYISCCAAIRDADLGEELSKIEIDTLVITGSEDPSTTILDAESMVKKIPKSKLAILPARHIPCMEQPAAYTRTLVDFLVGESTYSKGMHVRRTVLGSEHLDRANQSKNEFTTDFQDLITNYAWGEVWTRPGLSKHNRSLITLAMMIALNRRTEFKMHVKAALHNGVSREEIKEVILQSGIYCGLPAANDAFHAAQEVFESL